MSVSLGRLVAINPATPEFDRVPEGEQVTFLPLEACWPDGKADLSRRATRGSVAVGYTRFRRGDVLMPKITPTFEAGRVFTVNSETPVGAGTTELHVLRARPGVEPRYIAYLCRSQRLLQEGHTSLEGVGNLRRVPIDFLRLFPVAVADGAEQRAIADYLDRETAQIDALIGKQERLIETLRERRAAVATTILGPRVAKGGRLKSSLMEIDDRAGGERSGLPLMSVSISWGVRRRSETGAGLGRADELAGYKVCQAGDIVINRMRAFQGALGVAPEVGVVSPDYAVLRVREGMSSEWLAAVMVTRPFVAEMACRVRGIGHAELGSARTPRLNVADLLDIRMDVPCAKRQQKEVVELRNGLHVVDGLIEKARTFVALAGERRSALITAAVTGQIDVRTAA